MKTLSEVKSDYAGEYIDIELYVINCPIGYGTVRLYEVKGVDEADDDSEVKECYLMDEAEYNRKFQTDFDFDDIYRDKNAKVLVVIIYPKEEEL